MQIFGVSLSSLTDVLNIRRCFFYLSVFLQFFSSLMLSLGGTVLGLLCTGMLNRSPQKTQTLDFIRMLQKKYFLWSPVHSWSSLFIPYLGCCVLKYQTYSSQGQSEEEPKLDTNGCWNRGTVFRSRKTCSR